MPSSLYNSFMLQCTKHCSPANPHTSGAHTMMTAEQVLAHKANVEILFGLSSKASKASRS